LDDVRGGDQTERLHLHAVLPRRIRHDGRLVRESVGHNRKEAERALDARRGDVARRTHRVIDDIRFDAWADRWLAGFTGKANTRRVYEDTLDYDKRTFARAKVRDLAAGEVRRFLDLIRSDNLERPSRKRKPEDGPPPDVSPATLAKASPSTRRLPAGRRRGGVRIREPSTEAAQERTAESREEPSRLLHRRRTQPALARARRPAGDARALQDRDSDGTPVR
jgi:hypothetical protein